MCRVFGVSRSGYYEGCNREECMRSKEDRIFLQEISKIHLQSRQAYGYIKIWKALQAQGIAWGKHRVARIRKQHGIETKRSKRFKITTRSKHQHWIAPDHVKRRFYAEQPNQIWAKLFYIG